VRELARQANLRTSAKKDSQEICFVPSNDYRNLLAQERAELHPGELVDTAGSVLGRHEGTEHFTIGQRRGHGVAAGEPLYVVALEPQTGRVVLGTRAECASASMRVSGLNWIGYDPPASGEFRCEVQQRSHAAPAPCRVSVAAGVAEVAFDQPELSVTPGQGAAFYRGTRLLGGGWIDGS
jgi:tRNA-specific 2-thiouridylase